MMYRPQIDSILRAQGSASSLPQVEDKDEESERDEVGEFAQYIDQKRSSLTGTPNNVTSTVRSRYAQEKDSSSTKQQLKPKNFLLQLDTLSQQGAIKSAQKNGR